jgi:hypothetical protein
MGKTYYRVRVVHDEDPANPREWENPGTMLCWHRRYNLGDENPWKDRSPEEAFLGLVDAERPGFEDEIETWFEAEDEAIYEKTKDRQLRDSLRETLGRQRRDKIGQAFEELYVALPLYLYDHSGITMSGQPFSCPWDSGQVGFIYISRKKANENYGGPAFAAKDQTWNEDKQKAAIAQLMIEVKVFDQFITGAVYGRQVEKLVYAFEQPEEEVEATNNDLPWEHADMDCYGFFGYDPKESGILEDLPPEVQEGLREAHDDIGRWVLVEAHEPAEAT